MKYCKRCVYPVIAVNLDIGDEEICSSCKSFEKAETLTTEFWEKRKARFEQIVKENIKNNTSNYDCLIPVSGGKDSYYQIHVIAKEFGLKPLLMTYHGNNFLPEGDYNRDRVGYFRHV